MKTILTKLQGLSRSYLRDYKQTVNDKKILNAQETLDICKYTREGIEMAIKIVKEKILKDQCDKEVEEMYKAKRKQKESIVINPYPKIIPDPSDPSGIRTKTISFKRYSTQKKEK